MGDDDWHLCTKNLSTNAMHGCHTDVHIAKALIDVSTDFKILKENIACVVTDNASNMDSACREGEFEHDLLCSYSSAQFYSNNT